MFKNNRIKRSNEFGDENYIMKDYYEADKLIVAKFQRISSRYIEDSPALETTHQKYFFEPVHTKNKTRYREIFTVFITDDIDTTTENAFDSKFFDLPYVFEKEEFTKYFPQTKGSTLPKLSLIWALNDVNDIKEKEFVKTINKKN